MGKNQRRLIRAFLLLAVFIFGAGSAFAAGEAALREAEWTWDGGGEATFSGTVSADAADAADAVWHLELETNRPEDQGSVLFTAINGKQLKMRKRSDTVEADFTGGKAENTFEASWYLPEDTAGITRAVIRFRLTDAAGQELAAGEMTMGDGAEGGESAAGGTPELIGRWTTILLIAAAAAWLAAICRCMILRRARAKKK